MKRFNLFLMVMIFCFAAIAQFTPQSSTLQTPEEVVIGDTYYDLQTNASCQNRLYRYDDGTIGAVWTIGHNYSSGFYDRGTGYNFYDGENWGEWPFERVESDRAGWPSYAPLGESGEIIIAHLSGASINALVINSRPLRGTGAWNESYFYGPPGYEHLLWPRLVTGGENNNHVYLFALTKPITNGGQVYNGINGALVYSRSTDGGNSWDILNETLPVMDSSSYKMFLPDSYTFANPKDSIVAFVAGSYANDLFLVKSTNYGETFEKTLIWDHPYDQGYQIIPTDTFYCTDGSLAAAIGPDAKVHVTFGISKTYFTGSMEYHKFQNVDGLGYWNEDMPSFSTNKNALNPYNHPESELVKNYNFIGWMQDMDGDSVVTLLNYWGWGYYGGPGMSSMPQIVVDDFNRIFVIYSSITETFHNGLKNYRHLWMRSSLNGGNSWEQFYHYYPDETYLFDEFSYVSCSPTSDENIYFMYMADNEPGITWQGSTFPYAYCYFRFVKIPKDDIVGIKKPKNYLYRFEVSQNYPNPASNQTLIKVKLDQAADINLKVVNPAGQVVYEKTGIKGNIGLTSINLDVKNFSKGLYFYTISSGNEEVTRKLIIE